MTKMTNKVKKVEMVEISKSDLSTLFDAVYILKQARKSRDTEAMYNIIEDGSIDSPTFDETCEYTDSEIEGMEKHIDTFFDKWNNVIKQNWEKTI
jgi:hypothetical protein